MKSAKQIVIITGAARGIGLELTRQNLAQGHQVIVGVREPKEATDLQALQSKTGTQLTILELDVQSDESVRKFASALKVDHIDVLINNAGVYIDSAQDSTDVAAKSVLETLNINSVGPIRVAQALLPLLKKSSEPRIANISSQMGSIGDNSGGGSVAYRMSKAAVNMFTKTLAIDEKSVISLALHPGWVKTRMGGAQAPLEATASAEGLLNVILGAKSSDSGKFLSYSGRDLPW